MSREEKEIVDLLRRYLSGECTPDEIEAVERWLEEDPDHQEYFNAIKKVWDVQPSHDVDVDFEEEWRRITWRLGIEEDESNTPVVQPGIPRSGRDSSKSKDTPLKYLLRVAAVILLIGLPALYFVDFGSSPGNNNPSKNTEMAMQEIHTARGERASMKFSDGSQITLNSESTVRFPKVFNGSKREVYLEGEAFFRVIHNDEMPFIVHVNGVVVMDIGTEFNINAYKKDKSVEVVVREGKVSVKQNKLKERTKQPIDNDNTETSEVFLTKGQRTLVKPGEHPSEPENVSLVPYLAWVNGRMVFEGIPMQDVIPRLERAYDLNVEVRDSTLLSERLKASFKRETPEKVLGIIAFSLGIDYELRGDTVIFKSKNKGKTQ